VHLKEKALEKLTHKPVCWFHYMDDTFIIWPHGPGKLLEFLDNINNIHENIQFTVESERDDHLPFLDTDIYYKPDSSLSHKVYCKPTHTNLYLNSNSHHHLSNKQVILSILVGKARSICDQEGLHSETEFYRTIFRQNSYSGWQIQWALNRSAKAASALVKPVSVTFLPT
jgi:hypothetical protein